MSVDPYALPFSIDKAWVYVSCQGQLDTLRAVMSGPAADTVLQHGWIRYHRHFLLVERQVDTLFKLLKWARARVPTVAHIQTSEMFYSLYPSRRLGSPAAGREGGGARGVRLGACVH